MSSLRNDYGAVASSQTQPVTRFLVIGGAVGGFSSMNQEHATPTDYYMTPDPGNDFLLSLLSVNVGDVGSPPGIGFGNRATQLSFGLKFYTERDGARTFFPPTIFRNIDLVNVFSEKHINSLDADVNRVVNYMQPIVAFSDGLPLRSRNNDAFGVQLRDDCRDLPYFTMQVTGAQRLAGVS